MSDAPLVFCFDIHTLASSSSLPGTRGRTTRLETSNAASVLFAIVVPMNPLAAVAETFPAWKRAIAITPALSNPTPVNLRRICDLLVFFSPSGGRRSHTIGQTHTSVQAVKSRTAEFPPLAVEYRSLPSPFGHATIGFPGLHRLLGLSQESALGESTPPAQPASKPPEDRLDSWKEIAAYLNRDVTTVQRWEKREGMPVHRHLHDRAGSIYASRAELDAWVQSRSLRANQESTPDNGGSAPSLGGFD